MRKYCPRRRTTTTLHVNLLLDASIWDVAFVRGMVRHDLVREGIRDTETYSSRYDQFLAGSQLVMFQQASPEVQQQLMTIAGQMVETPPTMLTLDEPDHTKYRSLVNQLFTVSRIKSAEVAMQAIIDECIATMSPSPVEFMSAVGFPIPLRIIGDRLGIPLDRREFFDKAATQAASALRLTPLTGEA